MEPGAEQPAGVPLIGLRVEVDAGPLGDEKASGNVTTEAVESRLVALEHPPELPGWPSAWAARHPMLRSAVRILAAAAGVAHPVRGELAVLPEHERLRPVVEPPGGQVLDLGDELPAQLDHEVAHPLAAGRRFGGRIRLGVGQFVATAPGAQRSARRPRIGSVSIDQIVARYLRLSPASSAKPSSVRSGPAEGRAVLEPPGGEEVVGVIDLLPPVEVDDPLDAILVAVGVGDHRVGREGRGRPA